MGHCTEKITERVEKISWGRFLANQQVNSIQCPVVHLQGKMDCAPGQCEATRTYAHGRGSVCWRSGDLIAHVCLLWDYHEVGHVTWGVVVEQVVANYIQASRSHLTLWLHHVSAKVALFQVPSGSSNRPILHSILFKPTSLSIS